MSKVVLNQARWCIDPNPHHSLLTTHHSPTFPLTHPSIIILTLTLTYLSIRPKVTTKRRVPTSRLPRRVSLFTAPELGTHTLVSHPCECNVRSFTYCAPLGKRTCSGYQEVVVKAPQGQGVNVTVSGIDVALGRLGP